MQCYMPKWRSSSYSDSTCYKSTFFSVRYLARQGLAFRGYEEKEGNMMQLLQMWSLHDADIKHWLRDGMYLSHIINEQIKLMGDHVLRVMLSEIKS